MSACGLRRLGPALANAIDQRSFEQIKPMRCGVGSHRPQGCVVAGADRRILFLEALLVGDGLLLHVLDLQRAAKLVVVVEDDGRRFLPHYAAEQGAQLQAVVDSEVEPETSEWIVDVRGIAGKEHSAPAERGREPAM